MLQLSSVVEQEKYSAAWQIPAYGDVSPGEHRASLFGSIVAPLAGETLIDLGCGKGAGGLTLHNRYGLNVTYLDIVKVSGVPKPFIQQSLWKVIAESQEERDPLWKYGYCCDVMEHIPPEFSMLVIKNMLDACSSVFFSIDFCLDMFGPKNLGEPLHLTIRSFAWWRDHFREVGNLWEARDLLGQGVFYVSS
jgi:hypothetical protein